jgi:hypothetical protein
MKWKKGWLALLGKGLGNEIGSIPRKVKIAYRNRDKAFDRTSSPASIFKE